MGPGPMTLDICAKGAHARPGAPTLPGLARGHRVGRFAAFRRRSSAICSNSSGIAKVGSRGGRPIRPPGQVAWACRVAFASGGPAGPGALAADPFGRVIELSRPAPSRERRDGLNAEGRKDERLGPRPRGTNEYAGSVRIDRPAQTPIRAQFAICARTYQYLLCSRNGKFHYHECLAAMARDHERKSRRESTRRSRGPPGPRARRTGSWIFQRLRGLIHRLEHVHVHGVITAQKDTQRPANAHSRMAEASSGPGCGQTARPWGSLPTWISVDLAGGGVE